MTYAFALLVIKNVPARVCDLCDEAYISPETSRRIDEIMEKYHARKLVVRPIPAGEIDVNYRVLKGAACDYAKSRVAYGWLTLRAGYPVA